MTAAEAIKEMRDRLQYTETSPYRDGFSTDPSTTEPRTLLSLVNISYNNIVTMAGFNQVDEALTVPPAGEVTLSDQAMELVTAFTAARELQLMALSDMGVTYGFDWRTHQAANPVRVITDLFPKVRVYPRPLANTLTTFRVTQGVPALVNPGDVLSLLPVGQRTAVPLLACIRFCTANSGTGRRGTQLEEFKEEFASTFPTLKTLAETRTETDG